MADKNGNKNNNKDHCKILKDFKGDRNGYISLSEAAEYTPYSQEYLSLLSRHGKFRSLKVGRDWVTTINWVEEYLKNQQKNPKDFKGDRNGYISLSEAAEYTPYSQEYLSLRARQGKLKSTKFGRDWMTTINWVADYLREYNGKNGNGTENKKFLENLTKSYGAVLKYGAVTAVLFLIIYFGLSSQNLKLAVGKVFSSTGEKYLVAKDWMKFYWTKQRIKAGQIFVSTKDQANKFLENTKEESFALAQTFASDYKNKIQNFDNGLSAAKNFTTQGMKNFEIKTSGVASQSKIVAKSFVSQGKFVSAVFSDKTKEMGNFITGSLEPVKNLPKVLSSGKNLAKEKLLTFSRQTSDLYKLTAGKSLALASSIKNQINGVYSKGTKNITSLTQQFASLGNKNLTNLSKTFNNLSLVTKNLALNTGNNFSAVYQKINSNVKNSLVVVMAKLNSGTKNLASGLAKAKENIINATTGGKIVALSSISQTKGFIKANTLNTKELILNGLKNSQNFVSGKIFAFSGYVNQRQNSLKQIILKQVVITKQVALSSFGAVKNSINGYLTNLHDGATRGLSITKNFTGKKLEGLTGSISLAYTNSIQNINKAFIVSKENLNSISQKTTGLFNNAKNFIAKNVLTSKALAFYTFKKSQSFIGEELLALQTSFKGSLSNSQKFISGRSFAFKDSVSKGWSYFSGSLGKNVTAVQKSMTDGLFTLRNSTGNNINNFQGSIAKSFALAKNSTTKGINSAKNSIIASFTVARNSVASAISSTRNFAKQTSQKAVLKTGQSLVMANNKFVERPAEIISGSISSGVKVVKNKTTENIVLTQNNLKSINQNLKAAVKKTSDSIINIYSSSKDGAKDSVQEVALLKEKTQEKVKNSVNESVNKSIEVSQKVTSKTKNNFDSLTSSAKNGVKQLIISFNGLITVSRKNLSLINQNITGNIKSGAAVVKNQVNQTGKFFSSNFVKAEESVAKNILKGKESVALSVNFMNNKISETKNAVYEKWLALNYSVKNSVKNNVNVAQNVITKSFILAKGSTINGINSVKNSIISSFTVAKNLVQNSISTAQNSITTSFTVARDSVVSVISSTHDFTKQTSQKAVLKTGQGLVMANNKIVEHPAEILSGSIYSGFETAKTKINNNLNLAQQNIKIFNKDLNISLNQASKDMTIPYFAFKEGIQKTKDGTILLANKAKQSITKGINTSKTFTLNIFDRSKKFIGNQILALKTSVNNNWSALNNSAKSGVNSSKQFAVNSWGNFSDKLSNGYLTLLNYLIPERSLTPTPLVSPERIVKKSDTGVVVLPTVGGAGISQNKYLLSKIEESFSDEVIVEPSKDGNVGVIKPTQPAMPGEEYLYMVVPIKPEVKK